MATSEKAPIDVVKEYWDRRPCNIRHSPREFGTREYFDEVERRKYFVEPHIPGFAQHARWRGKRVLEIGCGIGTDAVNFARSGADYSAIELSGVSLEATKRRFNVYGLAGRFVEGNSEDLTRYFANEAFDLVYSFGVIHHTPHPRRVIDEIRHVLKPDGELRLMIYAKNSWKDIMIEAGFDQPEAQAGCPIAFTYTRAEARALLEDFDIISIEQHHIFPYVPEKYVRYEYEVQPWFRAMPPEMFEALEKRLGWHLCIAARPLPR